MNISLNAFPNPTAGKLTLQVNDFDSQKLYYTLFDIHGQVLESKLITSNQAQIDMSSSPAGTYIINVTKENKQIQSFKIIRK
jgi:hypothetical protein